MAIFKSTFYRAFQSVFRWLEDKSYRPIRRPRILLESQNLRRKVAVDIFLPPDYYSHHDKYFRVLYFNDGQDMEAVSLEETLENLYAHKVIYPIIVVAIHTNEQRIFEYGTAGRPDYKNRGNKAAQYSRFILTELLPYLKEQYRLHPNPEYNVFAGFSLGGLSAIDIAWNHADHFGKVGVFSGALWWRFTSFTEQAPDADRIMHDIIRQTPKKEGLQFWFEAGTCDETSDRNHNGVIDAIDDTLDLIRELKNKGYQEGLDIRYLEVEGGEHNHDTWREVLPEFLIWAFGKS